MRGTGSLRSPHESTGSVAPPPPGRHIPGPDGIRAVSILIVILAHLSLGTQNFPYIYVLERLGNFGVRIFFVLSGFLITSILLAETGKSATITSCGFIFGERCVSSRLATF